MIIEAVLRRFIWLPNGRDYAIRHTVERLHATPLFDHAPRIALHSPVASAQYSLESAAIKPGYIC